MSDSENGKGDNETTPPDVKEDNEDQKESTDSKQEEKSTNEEKKPRKPTKKEEVKEEEEEENEDEGSEESEEEVGLLDRPVEVSGSRERKKVERLELNFKTPSKATPEIPEGRGEKLGECPRIELKIQKTPFEELKALHKLMFNRPGSAHEIKRNIRKFCGFSFSEGSTEYEKKKSWLEKTKLGVLKQMCEVLDIERSGTREEIALRVLQFLLEPKSSGKAIPTPKSKKRSSTKGGRAKRAEKGSKKGSAKKTKKASDSEEEGTDESFEKDEEDEEEQDDAAADESDDSYEEPKQKKKSKPKKKKEVPLKEKKKEKNGEKSKKSEDKKTPAKSSKRKSVGSSDDSDESSDGEPLAKKVKSPPSDDEIKQLVKKILDDADLEEITMKKVIKQVFDAYPDFDLSEKKDYIKATVKSVIS